MAEDDWNGDGDLDNNADWSLGVPPGPGDDVVIQSGTLTEAGAVTLPYWGGFEQDSGATFVLTGAGQGQVQVRVRGDWNNLGQDNLNGGANLTVDGTLDNGGVFNVGAPGLTSSAVATVGELQNTGTITLQGAASGTAAQATLAVSSFSGILTGTINLEGDADLELPSAITTLDGNLTLDGANARASIGSDTTNSALSGLTSNEGTLDIESNNALGAGDASVTIAGNLNNTGVLEIDTASGDGGSSFTVDGAATNDGTIIIGNSALDAPTTVNMTELYQNFVSSPDITWIGEYNTNGTANQTTVNVSGSAPTTLIGHFQGSGDAELVFGSGDVTSIASGSSLELDGSGAKILTDGGLVSALSDLSSNAGTLELMGGSGLGAGGVCVTTSTNMINTGTISVDTVDDSNGGSTLGIGGPMTNGGTLSVDAGSGEGGSRVNIDRLWALWQDYYGYDGLTNTGRMYIVNDKVSDSTSMTVPDFTNSGDLNLVGNGANSAELGIPLLGA